jgi:hypothetical protein
MQNNMCVFYFHTLPDTAPVLIFVWMLGCSGDFIGNGEVNHVIAFNYGPNSSMLKM